MSARRLAMGLVALAVAAPAGYALADSVGGDSGSPDVIGPDEFVPASECDAAVNEAWEHAGMPRDAFVACPTAAQAEREAAEFNELRRRGLTQIAAGLEKHGDSPEDQAELEQIRDELAALGGPLPDP